MDLKTKLLNDLTAAMKARDENRVRIIRLIRGNIRKMEIDQRRELSDEDVIGVLLNSVKQHEDSIKAYAAGNRSDLVAQETEELNVLRSYLPQPLTPDEINKIIESVIKETGALTIKDIGKVMPKVMAQAKGRASGSELQTLVRNKLSAV